MDKIKDLCCTAIGVESVQEFIKKYNEGELCFYTKSVDGIEIPIEFDLNGKIFQTEILNEPVIVENKIFYDSYQIICDENGIDSIVVSPNIKFNIRKRKLEFGIKSGIKLLKKDADFMRVIFKQECEIIFAGCKKCAFKYKLSQEFREQLDLIDLLYTLFNNIGVTLETPYSQFNENDIEQINFLINVYKREKDSLFKDNPPAYKFLIDNHYVVLLILIDNETNEMEFVNLFRENGYIAFHDKEDGTRSRIPIFGFKDFDSEIFSKLYDENYEYIVSEFVRMDFAENDFDSLNSILLRLIDAYDFAEKRKIVIDTAEKIAQIMVEKYPDNDVAAINYLQVKKRLNLLSKEDKTTLSEMKKRIQNPFFLCGINILLENNYEVLENYSQMTEQEREMFKCFPISKLYAEKFE